MSNWTPENPFLNTDDLKEYAQYILGLAESDNPDMPDSFYDWAMSTSEEKVGISTLFGYEGPFPDQEDIGLIVLKSY